MRALSPIRSLSPGPKPKIVFNYQPSPLRERPLTYNVTPNSKFSPTPTALMVSPSARNNYFMNDVENAGQSRCIICPKQATYRTVKEVRTYCSTCAIEIMKKGLEVVRIELKDQKFYKDFHEKEHHINILSPKVKEFVETKSLPNKQRQAELDELITKLDSQQQDLQRLLENLNSEELTSQGIKGIYHQKKLSLKRHYEKIKAAIKLSIEKDLEELDRRERSSIRCIEERRQQLKDNIFLLKQIKQEVEPNRTEMVNTLEETHYQRLLNQHKEDTKNILDNKQISLQLINELTSNQLKANLTESEFVSQTQDQLANSRINSLYDPYSYTLIDSKHKKGETLFSFEGKIQ